MHTASSAYCTGYVFASSVEYTATVFTPSSLAGAHDAQRHLAAVRHQYLAEHYALSGPTAPWVAWGSM